MEKNMTPGRWRGTSPDGQTIDDIGANIVASRRRFDHEFRECSRHFAGCIGLTEVSADALRGTLEEYLASTDKQGYPEG